MARRRGEDWDGGHRRNRSRSPPWHRRDSVRRAIGPVTTNERLPRLLPTGFYELPPFTGKRAPEP